MKFELNAKIDKLTNDLNCIEIERDKLLNGIRQAAEMCRNEYIERGAIYEFLYFVSKGDTVEVTKGGKR